MGQSEEGWWKIGGTLPEGENGKEKEGKRRKRRE